MGWVADLKIDLQLGGLLSTPEHVLLFEGPVIEQLVQPGAGHLPAAHLAHQRIVGALQLQQPLPHHLLQLCLHLLVPAPVSVANLQLVFAQSVPNLSLETERRELLLSL